MSTATKSSSSDTHRYVDYDEFIDFQVQKTRTGIKSNDLLTALIGAAVAVLAYVLVFAIFDHWVIDGGFSRGPRMVLLSILVTGLLGWFVWKLAIPYFRNISTLFAAREIEQTEPGFRSTLLTLVDLKRSGRTVSPEIRAVLEKRAGLGLTHMNIEQAVDRRLLMRLSYVLLGLVVATCLYSVFSPKQLSNSLWRSLLPTSAVAVDTRTQIERVEPGDVDVLARSQLAITAELSGVIPEEVTLLYSTADRSLVDEPITMRESDDGIRQYKGMITGVNGRGILQSLTYRVVAGDATSETYSVTVSQPPSANVEEVEYEYPRYMGFRDRVQIGGAIDGWEGTWVTIRATANMPIESAMVKFSDTDDITQKAEELPVEIENGTLLTARWQLRIRPDGTFPNFYRIQCRNEAGKTDPSPALHPIKIRPDQPPQVQLAKPTSDLERPANAVVPLLYAAQDPDFLLRAVTLRFEKNGESLVQSPRLYESPPDRKAVADTYDLDLSQFELKPGDKLSYWLEARDNMEPFADRSGNRSNTPKLNIHITEPVSQEQVEQQREQDQQELEQQLDELRKECEVGSEASGEQPADSTASEPDPSSAAEEQAPGEPTEPADGEPSEGGKTNGEQTSGDQSSGDPQQGTGSQSEGQESGAAGQQRQEGPGNGEQSQQQSEQGQQQGDSSQSDQQASEEVPFDDLLKRLMQKEQQQAQQQSEQNQSGDQPPQQPNDPSQQGEQSPPQENPQSAGEQDRSGQSSDANQPEQPTGTEDSPGTSSDKSEGNQGGDPSSSSSNSESPSSAGETAQPTQQTERPSAPPRPGQGTEPASDSTNPNVRQGDTEEGQPSNDNVESPEGSQNPSDPANREGARREPADGTEKGDPMTTRKDGSSNSENRRPTPEGTNPPPSPNTEPPSPPNGQNSPGSPSPSGQQSGSDPSSPGSDNSSSSNNSSGQPQGGSQSASQSPSQQESQSEGQPQPAGDSQKSPGSESQPSQPAGQGKGGEPQPQDGSKPTPQETPAGGGSESPTSPDQQSSSSDQPAGSPPEGAKPSPMSEGQPSPQGQPPGSEQSPSSDQSSPPSGGEQSADQGQQQGGSSESGGQQQSGDNQQSGGQSENGGKESGQGGGQQPGGGQPSGGQQPSGSQPGGQPGQGSPQSGSTSSAEGGGSGASGDQGPSDGPPSGGDGNGDQPQAGNGAGEGEAPDTIQGDEPDLEAKRKAANLVLKELQDQLQRGKIDPELKEELGVTDGQLRNFTQRLQQRLNDTGEDTSPEADARRRQFEETLRNFEFKSTGTEREGGDGPRQATGGFATPERTAPLNKRDAVRQYREILNRQRQRSN